MLKPITPSGSGGNASCGTFPAVTANRLDSKLPRDSPPVLTNVYLRKYEPAGSKPPATPAGIFTAGAVAGGRCPSCCQVSPPSVDPRIPVKAPPVLLKLLVSPIPAYTIVPTLLGAVWSDEIDRLEY